MGIGENAEVVESILQFWFAETEPKYWFVKDDEFDRRVAEQFGVHTAAALKGEYDDWNNDFSARLALILLLDQMTRNIYRGQTRAFSGDEKAVALALNALSEGQLDAEDQPAKRKFILMPLMHSESLKIQDEALPCFEKYTDRETLEYAEQHRDIIARFGRFPHRNAILGRVSSAEELEFLGQPGSSF